MLKKNVIQTIANKEMDRGEFLKYSGLVLLSLVGFKAVVNLLNQSDTISKSSSDTTKGFGGGKYGV